MLRPTAAFLKFYLFKGGLFQGSYGLLVAQKAAVGVQLKYAALWAVQNHCVSDEDRDPKREVAS